MQQFFAQFSQTSSPFKPGLGSLSWHIVEMWWMGSKKCTFLFSSTPKKKQYLVRLRTCKIINLQARFQMLSICWEGSKSHLIIYENWNTPPNLLLKVIEGLVRKRISVRSKVLHWKDICSRGTEGERVILGGIMSASVDGSRVSTCDKLWVVSEGIFFVEHHDATSVG